MWRTVKAHLWRWRGIIITAPTVAGAIIGLRTLGWLQSPELMMLDQFYRWRPAEPIDDRVVLVTITERDIQNVGTWPMPDRTLATVITQLKQQKPRAIGLDLYRDLPQAPGHAELVKVFESTPNLIGIQKVTGKTIGSTVNPPPALKKAGQVGANDLVSDIDGKVRRNLLSVRDPQKHTILSLAVQLSLLYLKAEQINMEVLDAEKSQVKLGKTIYEPLKKTDGSYFDLDIGGYQVMANFRNLKANPSFRSVSLTDVLDGKMPPNFVRDRVVLIGITAESSGDLFPTPYDPKPLNGVEVHADLVSQLLSSAIDGRSPLRFWSDTTENLWIIGWAIVGTVLCWRGRYRGLARDRRAWWDFRRLPLTAIATLSLTIALISGSYVAFLFAWWVPIFPGLAAFLGTASLITAYTAWSAAEMRQTFGRYLTDEVVANLLETPEGLKLGGERRITTILISDLRGFSAISERLTPEKAVSVVNLYLEAMTTVINRYHGTINEFLGDGILVMFGTPIQRPNDPERAVACAIAMQIALQSVNQQLQAIDLPALEMGIGIHTGEVLAGNVGSQQRAKYTVIGNTVNLASRIESYTVGGQILISEQTHQACGNLVKANGQLQIRVKGIREPITVYEVCEIGGEFNQSLPKEELHLTPLKTPLPLHYRIVEGKALSDDVCSGTLLQVSEKIAEMQADQPLEPLTNLVLNLLVETQEASELWDVYVKVVEVFESDATRCYLRFTSVPPVVADFFHEIQFA